MEIKDILGVTQHRPFPLPAGPWVMEQTWNDLLFAHWKMPAEILKRRIPSSLELDSYQGDAYIAVTPFKCVTSNLGYCLPFPLPQIFWK